MEAVKPHGGSWEKARFSLQVNSKGIYYMKQHEVQECILLPWYSPPVLLRIIRKAAASSWRRRRGRGGECYGNASPVLRCCKKFNLSNSSTKLSPLRYCKETVKDLAQKLEVFLYSRNIKGHFHNKMILPPPAAAAAEEGEYMNELIELVLGACHEIECLIDTMNHHHQQLSHYDYNKTIFSNLLKLRLYDLPLLKTLCHGQPPSGLFEKLEELLIINCHRLHSIVSGDKLINFCNLKSLQVRDCGNLESLFTSSTAQNMISLEVLKVKYCETMKHIITHEGPLDGDIVSKLMFPKLKQVNIRRCYNMRCLMAASFAGGLSRLEILKIEDAPALEYVFGEYNNDRMVQNLKIDLSVLKLLKLTNLPNIISISPENFHVLCPSLDRPHLRGCPNLISMFGLDLEDSQQSDEEADTKQDLGLSTQLNRPMVMVVPAINMESNSEPEGLSQDYKNSEDKEEAKVKVQEKRPHDDDEDKGEEEAEQDRKEKYGIQEHNSRVIEQSASSRVGSRELDEELIEKQPKVELELPLVLEEKQKALEEHKASTNQHPSEEELVGNPSVSNHCMPSTSASVALPLPVDLTVLSPSTSITTTPLTAAESVDFHGLFKIKERRARLLEEAFVKYPHLWEWKLSHRTPRICKVGYKSLADMLAFLESETPKTMDDSKMEEFEKLYYELEYFGFDKMWLTSVRQRVMGMKADHRYKLKQLDKLESQISILEEHLSDAKASLASVKDDLSKLGHVFGFLSIASYP